MRKKIDPASLGLRHSLRLEQDENTVFMVINRKSRIVMKDGQAILKNVEKIMKSLADVTVRVETSAPVCSKTKQFLKDQKVEIHQITL